MMNKAKDSGQVVRRSGANSIAFALIAAFSLGATCASAQTSLYSEPNWYISAFGGHSFRILASQDIRTDYGFGVAWAQPEPHFKWRYGTTQLVIEGYYQHSNGQQHPTRGKVTDAIGAIWYGRFRFQSKKVNLFLDLGEGAQLADSESFDLGTRFNSTPMLGFGFSLRQGKHETLVGLRFLHISNAGLFPRNRGQNQLLFYTAVKF